MISVSFCVKILKLGSTIYKKLEDFLVRQKRLIFYWGFLMINKRMFLIAEYKGILNLKELRG